MNALNLSPEDPRLTAFALGELEGDERAAVAAAVQADPALQAAVAEVQSLAGELEEALASEPVEPTAAAESAIAPEPSPERKFVRFPYYWITGLAAAGFAVLVAVRDEESPVREERRVFEIDLRGSGSTSGEVAVSAEIAAPEGAAADAAEPEVALPDATVLAEAPPPVMPALELRFDEELAPVTLPLGPTDRPAAPVGSPAFAANAPDHAPLASPSPEGRLATVAVGQARKAETKGPGVTAMRTHYVAPSGAAEGRVQDLVELSAFSVPAPQTSPAGSLADVTEHYATVEENGFRPVVGNPLSTFAVDVDTGSYANVRRMLVQGQRPPRDAVRIEELVNYFPYAYAGPAAAADAPFAAHLEVAAAPWAPEHRLVRVGLKARDLLAGERGAANLVFLLDVSGSMSASNKLPLVKDALRQLLGRLQPEDRVAIVTYAGDSGLALPSTPARQSREILAALDALTPGGSTNGAMGIHLAYDVAKANFIAGGINRVILCTDGDFNVGVTNPGDLGRLIGEKARSGVFLTALGFGMGNYRDDTLERLADRGNGHYGYIDSPKEARKLLVEQVDGTLATVAKDVKVQVEFNPAQVQAYRLIGYENRWLRKEDFNDDTVDAGEVGAGHTVTALYEIIPVGVAWNAGSVDALKYQATEVPSAGNERAREGERELLTVKVRYQPPQGGASRRVEFALSDRGAAFAQATEDFRFAAAVAGFGMVLRESPHRGTATLPLVLAWAQDAIGADPGGHRREFLELVREAIEVAGG